MISRRTLLLALGSGALAWVFPVPAQQRGKPWRVGFFYLGSRQSAMETGRYLAFIQGMRELGYEEGKQFVLVARFADGEYGRIPGLATELTAAKLDVIVSTSSQANHALKQATATTPVVVTTSFDPVREGFAETLARPGRNFTGFSSVTFDISPKHVELLEMAVPKLSRIAALWHPGNAAHPALLQNVEAAARSHSIRIFRVSARTPQEIESGFETMALERVQALIILGDTFFAQQHRQLGERSVKHQLVSIYLTREYAELGGFMSYGPNFRDNYRRSAIFVDKILKGAKAGELPFEQPTKFELVVNRKTARALGLTLSQELLLRADEVIE